VPKQLRDVYEVVKSSVMAVEHVRPEKISDYGIVEVERVKEGLYLVRNLVDKPAPRDAPSDLGISGTYILTPAIFECLRRTKPGQNGEIQLTDALKLLLEKEKVYAHEFQGRRYDIGTKLDWFRTHMELVLQDEEFGPPMRQFLEKLLKRPT
jgi:UTP--glucose-1-phosphate uridylyltransferase